MEIDEINSTKVVAVVQARMGASRLPGKVLLDIGGEPMLDRVVMRTKRSQIVDQVVVATSTDKSDDSIAEYCDQQGYLFYRGKLHDVLDRYFQAAKLYSAGVIVRITADCPIIDPMVIDLLHFAHDYFQASSADFSLVSPLSAVRNELVLANVTDLIPTYQSVYDALHRPHADAHKLSPSICA